MVDIPAEAAREIRMRAPSELALLAWYRSRGQAPELTAFITDLGETFVNNIREAGAPAVRAWNLEEAAMWNWSCVAGLDVILAIRDPSSLAAILFARVLKAASP